MHVHRGAAMGAAASKGMPLAVRATHARASVRMPRATRAAASLRMFAFFCLERRQPMLDVHVDVEPQNDYDHDYDGAEAADRTPGMH